MAISEFVKRKLAIAYYRFDHDKDGVVTEGDFVHLGQEVVRLRGVEPGSAEADQIVEVHRGWWDAYFKGGDADGDGQVTLAEYLACVDAWVGSEPEALTHAIQGNCASGMPSPPRTTPGNAPSPSSTAISLPNTVSPTPERRNRK